jgi:GDP-L-fucose synthase
LTSFLCKKKLLVTGGAGFLGSYVVKMLEKCGCAPITVPRRVDCDLTKWENISRLLSEARPQIVIHLAAIIDDRATRCHAARSFYDNLMMGVQLIEACRQHAVEKLVCIGTATSYPKLAPLPFREEDFWNGYPDEVRGPYGMAKKTLLVQLQIYRQQYGFNGIYLIPTNLYGPGDNFNSLTGHVIPALIARFLAARSRGEREVVCSGSGSPTRDFLFVEDCAQAIVLATERYNDGEPVNLGSGVEISIRDLANHIARLVGFSGKIFWDTTKPDGQPRELLEVSRSERAFGFRPRKDFIAGLKETIDWYCNTLPKEQGEGTGHEKSHAGILESQ